MRHFHFYDLSTGRLLSKSMTAPDETVLAANTPAGAAAIEGRFDRESQRVDLVTLEVADWQPPQPSPQHEWVGRRWVLTAAAAKIERDDREARRDIQSAELSQARAVREALLELLPVESPARVKLAELDELIVGKRGWLK